MRTVLLGPPGAGKGTHAVDLSREFGIPHISTGDIFREEMKAETELGKLARSYIDGGNLVPDDVTIDIVRGRLKKDDAADGFILDGFPRTIPQAEKLDALLAETGLAIDAAIYLFAPEDVIIQRLSGRRVCKKCAAVFHVVNIPPEKPGVCDRCGGELYRREDDAPEAIRQRMRQYESKTAGLIDYYDAVGRLVRVDAGIAREDTYRLLKRVLADLR